MSTCADVKSCLLTCRYKAEKKIYTKWGLGFSCTNKNVKFIKFKLYFRKHNLACILVLRLSEFSTMWKEHLTHYDLKCLKFILYIVYYLHDILLYCFLYFADTILPVTMTTSLENSLTTKCLRNQGRTKGEGWSTEN